MNNTEFFYKLPKEDTNEDEAKIIEIKFKDGSKIKKNDVIYIFETAKVTIEVESQQEGYIHFFVKEDQVVDVGENVCIITNNKGYKKNTLTIKNKSKIFQLTKKAEDFIKNNKIKLEEYNLSGLIRKSDIEDLINKNEKLKSNKIEKLRKNKNENILILGFGAQALDVIELIETNTSYKISLIADNSENKKHSTKYQIIKDDENLIQNCNKLKINKIVICWGWIYSLKKRYERYKQLKELNFEFPKIISKTAKIYKSAIINDGAIIFDNTVVGSNSVVGEFSIINHQGVLSHDSFLGINSHICPGGVVASNCKIGKNCIIGINASIHYGLDIEDNKIIKNNESFFKN
tara:strand:- start:310 stop:1350 length:1041 start_codon:yes stop_codon:yes gene_type:complete